MKSKAMVFNFSVAVAACVFACGVRMAAGAVELPLADDVARAKAEAIRAKMTLEQKVSLLGGCATMYLKAYPELGIPREWAMSDCSHSIKPEHGRDNWPYVPGVDHRSVVMPPLSAVAMTWNPALAARHGTAMAEQMRALGKDQLLGPGVNINRTPLCGRNWEYMSEDPYLALRLVVPYVRAVQKLGMATTVKHFCLNNQELARNSVDTVVDERTLHEIYLPAFKAAIREGGSIALMTSYNRINGQHASENAFLQRGILRELWGFKGLIVTDWGGQHSTVPAALNGGNVEMDRGVGIRYFTDYFGTGGFPLLEAVKRGEVPAATVDDMVGRVLFAMAKTGFLDGVQPKGARFTDAQHRTQVEIGEEAITLLKNTADVLPLKKDATKKVVVLGLQADMKYTHLGSSCEGTAENEVTAFQSIRSFLGEGCEVKLLPLGDEAAPEGEIRPIPATWLETVRKDSTDAFVQRAWEVYRWNEGEEWTDRTIADGYADYPNGRRSRAIRYVAKVRAGESGPFGFGLAAGAHIGTATVKLDGTDVFSTSKSMMKTVELVRDRVYTVTVDVSDCRRDGDGFVFGITPIKPLAESSRMQTVRAADAVIVFTGTMMGRGGARECEGGDLPSMSEPSGHDAEIAKLLALGLKNLVIVNRSGTQLEMPWADDCATLLQVPYLGQDSAALPRVLFGDVNPSGRLACTFPRRYSDTAVARMGTYNAKQVIYNERFYVGYRWHDHAKIAPLFPFGYGLSYTTFAVDGVAAAPCADCDGWKVTAKVTNTGKTAGKEVVQLYVKPVESKVERCEKELKGFAKTRLLKPGESETVTMTVSVRDFAYYDEFLHRWRAPAGRYDLLVGTSAEDIVSALPVVRLSDVVMGE